MGLDVSEHGLLTAYAGFGMQPDTASLGRERSARSRAGHRRCARPRKRFPVQKMPTFSDERPKFTKVEILCKESRFEALKQAMMDIGITGMTMSHVLGCGLQKGETGILPGAFRMEATLLPKVQVDIVVSKVPVRTVIGHRQEGPLHGPILGMARSLSTMWRMWLKSALAKRGTTPCRMWNKPIIAPSSTRKPLYRESQGPCTLAFSIGKLLETIRLNRAGRTGPSQMRPTTNGSLISANYKQISSEK